MELFTKRTSLIPFSLGDIEILHDLFTDSFIRKYLWDDEIIPLDQTREILEINEKHFSENKFGLWKIVGKQNKEVIGFCGLWYFFDENQPQLIYGIFPKFTGNGFASEAAQKVTNYVFTDLGYTYLIASCDEPNVDSHKVAERVGMTKSEIRNIDGKPTVFYKIDHPNSN